MNIKKLAYNTNLLILALGKAIVLLTIEGMVLMSIAEYCMR